MKLHRGDIVIVTAGKDKGRQGKILKVFPKTNRVIVEGANIYARHRKPQQGKPGEIIRTERSLHTASVAILNPDTGKVDRIGYQIDKDGSKARIYKKTGKVVKQ